MLEIISEKTDGQDFIMEVGTKSRMEVLEGKEDSNLKTSVLDTGETLNK
jgi:hypothetical protein